MIRATKQARLTFRLRRKNLSRVLKAWHEGLFSRMKFDRFQHTCMVSNAPVILQESGSYNIIVQTLYEGNICGNAHHSTRPNIEHYVNMAHYVVHPIMLITNKKLTHPKSGCLTAIRPSARKQTPKHLPRLKTHRKHTHRLPKSVIMMVEIVC